MTGKLVVEANANPSANTNANATTGSGAAPAQAPAAVNATAGPPGNHSQYLRELQFKEVQISIQTQSL